MLENKKILFDENIERALLSSILKDPNILQDVSDQITVNDFYIKPHKIIYEYMLKSTTTSVTTLVDITLLSNLLIKENRINEVGGIDYLEEILDAAPTSSNYTTYLKIIKDYSKKRILYYLTQDINNSIKTGKSSFDDLLENTQFEISKLFDENGNSGTKTIAEVLKAELHNYQRIPGEVEQLGLPTDYIVYDELTGGLRKTDLLILAARPAMGKTALALNIGLNVALKNKKVLIFSLEMGEEQLARRLVCAVSKVPNKEIEDGSFIKSNEKVKAVTNAINILTKLDIHIDASSSSSISSIKNSCRNAVRKGRNLDLIIIDYLQLISISGKNNGNREQQISEISRNLKLLAKELKVPIITLSQLSRSVEKRDDKRPLLSDLRESGSIEQDADQVMFLYNNSYYSKDIKNNEYEEVEWVLAKHRNGSLGRILLKFYKSIQKFENSTKEEYENYFNKNKSD